MFLHRKLNKLILSMPSPRVLLSNAFFSKFSQQVLSELYLNALRHSQYWKVEELRRIQEKRSKILVSQAIKSTPFYEQRFAPPGTVDDFSSLPTVSKEEMRLAFDDGSIINKKLDAFKITFATSGSTGIPFSFYLDKNMAAHRLAIYRRTLDWVGKQDGDLVIRLFKRELPGVEQEGVLFPCSGITDLESKKDELFRLLHGHVILHGQTSVLIRFAQLFEKVSENGKGRVEFRAIINASETLHAEARSYLEGVFKTKVFDYYGSNEVPAIAQECEFRNGLHVNSEWVRVEIIDDNGIPVPPGETGNIVATFFDNEIVPFVRYQIGDRGYFLNEQCPCGRGLPRLHIEGRKGSSFELPNGETGYFFELARPILKLVSKIFQYQIIRESKTKFQIKIVPLPSFEKGDTKFIESEFRHYLGMGADISLEITDRVETAPSGKQRAFINLCPDRF